MGTFGEITLDKKISRYCPFNMYGFPGASPDFYVLQKGVNFFYTLGVD
jgi:hypothetical protein